MASRFQMIARTVWHPFILPHVVAATAAAAATGVCAVYARMLIRGVMLELLLLLLFPLLLLPLLLLPLLRSFFEASFGNFPH